MAENNKTVLIVDDESDVRDFISTILKDNGYTTISAVDGVDALEKVKASPPDLITLDVSMPEKSGVKFYREMKESDQWKTIPIVIVTGVTDEFKRFISTRRQVPPPEGYLSKPFDENEVLGLVKKLTA